MPDREPAMIVTTGNTADLLTGIGIAVRAYTQVEASQSRLLSVLLGIDIKPASAIFFSVQNVRSRNELFNTLLTQRFDDRFTKFWESCSSHLQRLAGVRNNFVHWHPYTLLRMDGEGTAETRLMNPMPGRTGRASVADVEPFQKDCSYIKSGLDQFAGHLVVLSQNPEAPSPDKFVQLIRGRTPADPQPLPNAKARKGPPRSSQA
jgi:hypothetical protein